MSTMPARTVPDDAAAGRDAVVGADGTAVVVPVVATRLVRTPVSCRAIPPATAQPAAVSAATGPSLRCRRRGGGTGGPASGGVIPGQRTVGSQPVVTGSEASCRTGTADWLQ